jgi:hypothetical protein
MRAVGFDAGVELRRAKTGAITYDPGLGNTGACQSEDHLHRR